MRDDRRSGDGEHEGPPSSYTLWNYLRPRQPSCRSDPTRSSITLLVTYHRIVFVSTSVLALAIYAQTLCAQAKTKSPAVDPRWTAIRRVFGQDGESNDGYFRINLPRSDLAVRIGVDALESPFEFTSYDAKAFPRRLSTIISSVKRRASCTSTSWRAGPRNPWRPS